MNLPLVFLVSIFIVSMSLSIAVTEYARITAQEQCP
jgi:hypothetical protein